MKRMIPMTGGETGFKRALSALLLSGVVLANVPFFANAQVKDPAGLDLAKTVAVSDLPVKGQIAITRDVKIAQDAEKITLNMRDANMRDVLNMLAKQGNFNIILDESVDGTLTVDIQNVSINKALEYIFTVANLSYTKDGNTLIVATKDSAEEKNMNARTFKSIPVLYRSADMVASQLNNTLFRISRPGGSDGAIAAADMDTNSLLIMGTDADIQLVGDALRELDMPRNRKVYNIRYNQPAYVAQVLSSNFVNLGTVVSTPSGGGGGAQAGGQAGGAQAGGQAGGAQAGGQAGGAQAGGQAGGAAAAAPAAGGAAGAAPTGPVVLNANGMTFIAEAISGTLTVMATDEQLAMVDAIISQVDVRRPQVAIEVALVEIQDSVAKTLAGSIGASRIGPFNVTTLGSLAGADGLENAIRWTQGSKFSFNQMINGLDLENTYQTTKSKILANPTVVAMDGTQTSINLTDEVASVNQTATIDDNGNTLITTVITKEQAGVTMDITPQIFNDGSVVLNMTPSVRQPVTEFETEDEDNPSTTFLISERSMTLSGVRVKDGQTLVIGGLLREIDSDVNDRVPGIDKMPILGAFLKNSTRSNRRTELVLMVTPHIIKEEAVTYFDNLPANSNGGYNNPNHGGIQPVSLPRYHGAKQDAMIQPAVSGGKGVKPQAGTQSDQKIQIEEEDTAEQSTGPAAASQALALSDESPAITMMQVAEPAYGPVAPPMMGDVLLDDKPSAN